MRIEIRFRGLDASTALRHHVKDRLHVHFGRWKSELRAADVRIVDVNGPRGGVDKECRIVVRGRRLGTRAFVAAHHDPYAAVDLATRRLALAARRRLDRHRRVDRDRGRVAAPIDEVRARELEGLGASTFADRDALTTPTLRSIDWSSATAPYEDDGVDGVDGVDDDDDRAILAEYDTWIDELRPAQGEEEEDLG